MTALIVATSLLLAHVTGAIQLVAPMFGSVGTIITTTDKTVADAIRIKRFISQHKVKKVKHT